jgi:hypothetical protein
MKDPKAGIMIANDSSAIESTLNIVLVIRLIPGVIIIMKTTARQLTIYGQTNVMKIRGKNLTNGISLFYKWR